MVSPTLRRTAVLTEPQGPVEGKDLHNPLPLLSSPFVSVAAV